MFSKLGDLYIISIFITNTIIMVVVMATVVKVFTAPPFSFCIVAETSPRLPGRRPGS